MDERIKKLDRTLASVESKLPKTPDCAYLDSLCQSICEHACEL